jgi:hypothetical protein
MHQTLTGADGLKKKHRSFFEIQDKSKRVNSKVFYWMQAENTTNRLIVRAPFQGIVEIGVHTEPRSNESIHGTPQRLSLCYLL